VDAARKADEAVRAAAQTDARFRIVRALVTAMRAAARAGYGSESAGGASALQGDEDAQVASPPICPTTLAYDLSRPDPSVLADALRAYVPTIAEAQVAGGYWAFLALAVERGGRRGAGGDGLHLPAGRAHGPLPAALHAGLRGRGVARRRRLACAAESPSGPVPALA
jgi:hypothetical protein